LSVIDCAFDEKFSKELSNYLNKKGYKTNLASSQVILDVKIGKEVLFDFLKHAKKTNYDILEMDSNIFVIAKKVDVEDFGLGRCDICGYIAFEEELFAHRRAHAL